MNIKISRLIFLLFFFFLFFSYNLNPLPIQANKFQEALQYEVTVTLKLIQVFVTDTDGNPIRDLEKTDFILYDNGKLKEITDFEQHFLTLPGKKAEEKASETKPSPPAKLSTQMNRKFFLFIDTARNDMQGIQKSKKAALHFIETQLQPSDEVALLSYDFVAGLKIHEYLTTNHEKIGEAIKKLREVPGRRTGGMPQSPIESGPGGLHIGGGYYVDLPDISDEDDKAYVFIKVMKELGKAFRYIPGYKNLILFSSGIPREELFKPDQKIRESYEDMGKELASSNTPVYTVNTEGGRAHFNPSSTRGDFSLKMLSEFSGGKYFQDVEYYETVSKEIQNITGNYYVLGYYIDEKWDGRYHDIKVKVKREASQVIVQKGYFNPKPFSEFSESEKQFHLIDLALSDKPYSQEPLHFPLVALPCFGENGANCVFLSEIQKEKLGDIANQKSELFILIFDEDKNLAEFCKGEVQFSMLKEKKAFPYTISSLPPGTYECRAVIRNTTTGQGAVGTTSVRISEPVESGIILYPPLVLVPDEDYNFLIISAAKGQKAEKDTLSLVDIYPFLSNNYSPLIEELDKATDKLVAVLCCSVLGIERPNVEISSYLIHHPSKQKFPLSSSIVASERKGKTDILLIELSLPELKPGEYSLLLEAQEASAESEALTKRVFRVKE